MSAETQNNNAEQLSQKSTFDVQSLIDNPQKAKEQLKAKYASLSVETTSELIKNIQLARQELQNTGNVDKMSQLEDLIMALYSPDKKWDSARFDAVLSALATNNAGGIRIDLYDWAKQYKVRVPSANIKDIKEGFAQYFEDNRNGDKADMVLSFYRGFSGSPVAKMEDVPKLDANFFEFKPGAQLKQYVSKDTPIRIGDPKNTSISHLVENTELVFTGKHDKETGLVEAKFASTNGEETPDNTFWVKEGDLSHDPIVNKEQEVQGAQMGNVSAIDAKREDEFKTEMKGFRDMIDEKETPFIAGAKITVKELGGGSLVTQNKRVISKLSVGTTVTIKDGVSHGISGNKIDVILANGDEVRVKKSVFDLNSMQMPGAPTVANRPSDTNTSEPVIATKENVSPTHAQANADEKVTPKKVETTVQPPKEATQVPPVKKEQTTQVETTAQGVKTDTVTPKVVATNKVVQAPVDVKHTKTEAAKVVPPRKMTKEDVEYRVLQEQIRRAAQKDKKAHDEYKAGIEPDASLSPEEQEAASKTIIQKRLLEDLMKMQKAKVDITQGISEKTLSPRDIIQGNYEALGRFFADIICQQYDLVPKMMPANVNVDLAWVDIDPKTHTVGFRLDKFNADPQGQEKLRRMAELVYQKIQEQKANPAPRRNPLFDE